MAGRRHRYSVFTRAFKAATGSCSLLSPLAGDCDCQANVWPCLPSLNRHTLHHPPTAVRIALTANRGATLGQARELRSKARQWAPPSRITDSGALFFPTLTINCSFLKSVHTEIRDATSPSSLLRIIYIVCYCSVMSKIVQNNLGILRIALIMQFSWICCSDYYPRPNQTLGGVFTYYLCVQALKMDLKAILVTILCFIPLIEGGKILFWCPFASKSVKITFIPLLDELSK